MSVRSILSNDGKMIQKHDKFDGDSFYNEAKKERVFSLKKKEVVMFFCIGTVFVILFSLVGMLAGRSLFDRYGRTEKDERKEEGKGNKEDTFEIGPGKSEEWYLMLVNRNHPLLENYDIPALTELKNEHAVDSRIYPELQAMMDAARAAGVEPLICSSYRAWDRQQELYIKKVRSYVSQGHSWETSSELAQGWVQKPGCSEHQTGLALDIVDTKHQLLDETQAETPVQKWLMDHCHEYGFILRYPKEKESLTGVNYEPWHYRYVGKEAAEVIMREGICLEEYIVLKE